MRRRAEVVATRYGQHASCQAGDRCSERIEKGLDSLGGRLTWQLPVGEQSQEHNDIHHLRPIRIIVILSGFPTTDKLASTQAKLMLGSVVHELPGLGLGKHFDFDAVMSSGQGHLIGFEREATLQE